MDSAEKTPEPTDERDKLVKRLMRHREISREEAEALVEEYSQGRSSDIPPELLDGVEVP